MAEPMHLVRETADDTTLCGRKIREHWHQPPLAVTKPENMARILDRYPTVVVCEACLAQGAT